MRFLRIVFYVIMQITLIKMFNNLILTFSFLCSSILIIYPSKKENTRLIDYCYSLEKILSRNSVEKRKNLSKSYKNIVKNITLSSTKKTKGAIVNKIIDQYKISKKSFIMTSIPNQFYCLAGYWIEKLKPGIFEKIFYKKSIQKINQYKDTKKEIDEFIKNFNSEYKYIKKEINDIF